MKKGWLCLALSMLVTMGGLFTSCENFLKAEELKNQIEAQIAYANAPTYTVTVNYNSDDGQLRKPAWGEISVKETDTFDLKFEPAKNHSFARWEATSADLPVNESIDDYITIENPNSTETKATFKRAITSVVINAVCPPLPFTEVSITGSNEKFSPSKGTYTCIDTNTYQLTFDPDSDYEFISWEIYDKNNGGFLGIIENGTYIKIDDIYAADTTYTFVAVPEDSNISLAVRPIVAERPQTTSCIPIYGVSNSIDSSINVIFDHDMDERSIYYTSDEIDALTASGITRFLPNNIADKKYGYKKNNVCYYKNISIIDENGNNLLSNFEAPVFETPKILSILPKGQNSIPKWTRINVTLDKSFFYEEEKPVTMAQSKKWVYMVTDLKDTTPPSISNITVKSGSLSISGSSAVPAGNDLVYNNDGKVSIDLVVQDLESGPDETFNIKIVDSSNTQKLNKNLSYQSLTSQRGAYKGDIDVSSYGEGLYKMQITVSDRKSPPNKVILPAENQYYYFKIDSSVPPVPTNLLCAAKTESSVTVAWSVPNTNFDQYILYYELNNGTEQGPITFIPQNTKYSYTITSDTDITDLTVRLATQKNGGTQTSSYVSLDAFAHPSPEITFFMPIGGIYSVTGRGTIGLGLIDRGTINIGESVQVLGPGTVISTVITGVDKNRTIVDSASEGETVGLLLRGVAKSDLSVGMLVVKPGEIQNHQKFKAFIYLKSTEEGGKTNPVSSNYRPQFYLNELSITGAITFTGTDINPGEDRIVAVELIHESPVFVGEQFLIREGGHTYGYGVIMEIIE